MKRYFYLPGEQGDYEERRVCKLDLLERDIDESKTRLERYLKYEAVKSGKAVESARSDYKDVSKGRQIKETLPNAWKRLIEDPDELLVELLSDRVADMDCCVRMSEILPFAKLFFSKNDCFYALPG